MTPRYRHGVARREDRGDGAITTTLQQKQAGVADTIIDCNVIIETVRAGLNVERLERHGENLAGGSHEGPLARKVVGIEDVGAAGDVEGSRPLHVDVLGRRARRCDGDGGWW